MRDDFTATLKETLARRAGMRCSNPNCRKPTSGPAADPRRAVNIGVAAHITAASLHGPRYDAAISSPERDSIENAVWLCQNCAKLVDSDEKLFTVGMLGKWKDLAEHAASLGLHAATPDSPIPSGVAAARAEAVPQSIRELMSITDLRASAILKEMDQAKRSALAWLTQNKDALPFRLPNAGRFAPLSAANDNAALLIDELFGGWNATSAEQLCEELDSLRYSFIELHALHKQELKNGNYVAAHEIVGQIHPLLQKYSRRSTPPGRDRPTRRYYIGRPDIASEMWAEQMTMLNYEKYPGLLPPQVMSGLPKSLADFLLVEGEPTHNMEKVIRWKERKTT